MKNILITGGCGFIGVNMVLFLLKKDIYDQIVILDNLSFGQREYIEEIIQKSNQSNKVKLYIGDICNPQQIASVLIDVEAVVHLAALTDVVESLNNPQENLRINVNGTFNLLEACRKSGVEKFIFASSNAVIGEQEPPISEDMVPTPISPYGASKLAGEALCSAYYRSFGLKTVSLRFANAYGPYCLHKNNVIARFFKDSLLNGALTIYGDGQQTRDFIYVEDICRAIENILNSSSDSIFGEVFHLGTGSETSILELALYTKELVGNDIRIAFAPERKGEIKKNYSDITKAKSILRFASEVNLQDGLRKVYEWFIVQDRVKIEQSKMLSGSK